MHTDTNEIRYARLERKARTGEPMTMQEVADYLGLSRSAVGNIEHRAMQKMRTAWCQWKARDNAAFAPQKRKGTHAVSE
jgi:DNA-directed RNA polymerase sigma subunit (sigma70/sigma32)